MRASNRPHLMITHGQWPEGTRFATILAKLPSFLYPERHPVAVKANGDVMVPFRGRLLPNFAPPADCDRARLIAR